MKASIIMAGTLFVVATPIGNLEDVTARALRVLREVAVIAAEDTRRTAHLLARYGIPTSTTSLHEHNEHQKAASLVARLVAGESIALVSDAGTPTVSDPGAHLITEALRAGLKVEPIPGPNAAIAALSASGFASTEFMFLGFPPKTQTERAAWFERLGGFPGSVVFYEAPHRIRWTLEEVQRRLGDVRVCVARELTKSHEELVIGPINSVLSAFKDPIGEYTVVVDVGHKPVIALTGEAMEAAAFQREYARIESEGLTRRQVVSRLSRNLGLSAREVYRRLEEAKQSVG